MPFPVNKSQHFGHMAFPGRYIDEPKKEMQSVSEEN